MDPDLIVNPFENDIAIDPRRIEKPVPGLNDRALDKLLAAFDQLTRDPLPRIEARLAKIRLVISPEAGYGKSHLIGRLFQALEGTATRINIQPFEDSETPWKSILDRIVYELKAPEKTQAHGPNPNETTQLHAFAHGVIAHLVADMVDTGLVRAKQPKAEVIKALREGRLATYEQARAHKQWPQFIAKTFGQSEYPQAMAECVEARGIQLWTDPHAWLRVLFTYTWSGNRGSRNVCLDWLKGESIDEEDAKPTGLKAANCPRSDMTAGQLNELCMKRILDLCRLAGFYRPFILCFDQTENYGRDPNLAKSLGNCIEVITREARNQMTVFTANAVPWNDAIRVHWEGAHLHRLTHPLELEGLDREQAGEFVTLRLQVCQAPKSRIARFLDGGRRIDEIVGEKDRIGIRSFLKFCARSWEGPISPRLSLGDLFREYCDKVASQPRRLEFNRDILRWLVQELAKGMSGVEVAQLETRPGHRMLCWRGEKQQILFDFDGGSHWQRWLKIAEDSEVYRKQHPGTKIVYLRTPELVSIPIPGRWPKIGPRIEEAKRRFLHILPLHPDEVKLIYAAHELHSDAIQGDIEFAAQEVLDFLRDELNRVWKRIMEPAHPEPVPPVHTLDEELRARVRKTVMRERFLNLEDLLRQLVGPNDRDTVLAACGAVAEIAIHHSPSMVVLQWQGRSRSAN
ncbi:MAG: hypothetical protein ACT4O2_00390 [Beijerinckiaceae bacterium]